MSMRTRELAVPYATHTGETFRMTWYEWGPEDAPPVVCVHGLTRNGRDFDFLAQKLAQKFRVIAPDMPGRGKSEWLKYPEEYNLASYAAYMLFLLPQLFHGPVRWVGTSMGGMLGMALAAQFPRMVRALVLNDVGSLIPGPALARLKTYVGKDVVFETRAAAEARFREIYTPFGIKSQLVWKHLFDHSFMPQADGTVRMAYDPAIAAALQAYPEPTDVSLESVWEKVTCPVLLIRGGKSDILPEAVAAAMAEKPGVQLHTVPGVGHAPTLTDDIEINLIMDWLSS